MDEFIRQNPGEVTEGWLHDTELRLLKAVEYFGADRDLVSIEPKHIRDWLNKKLSHLANGTQRHYLQALSGLYRYAQELGVLPACGASGAFATQRLRLQYSATVTAERWTLENRNHTLAEDSRWKSSTGGPE